jgi:hypothetical protein
MTRRGSRGGRRGQGPAGAPPVARRVDLPAGSSLGSLVDDDPNDPLDVSFDWYEGAVIRINPELSELLAIDFAERAMKVDEDSPQAMVLVKDQIRSYIHPDDFAEFWRLAVVHRHGVMKLFAFMERLVGRLTARPTGQPSDSSAGLPSTDQNSKDDSSSPVIRRLESAGRPDLALVHVQASEGRAAV